MFRTKQVFPARIVFVTEITREPRSSQELPPVCLISLARVIGVHAPRTQACH